MGSETRCILRIGRKKLEGEALLESKELIFRGDERLKIPFAEIRSVIAEDGALEITWSGGAAVFEIGAAAERWAAKIRSPKSRLDKLGVKPGQVVAVIGVDDPTFEAELKERGADVRTGRIPKGAAIVFLGMASQKDLVRLVAAEQAIARNGAIWAVWPKGRAELKEDHVRATALKIRLVDVKVASFSDTLSALKLVIPVKRR